MMPWDALGHLGYLLIFAGTALIARERAAGWLLRLAGEAMWLLIGLFGNTGLASIWVWGIAGMLVDSYGFYRWRHR